MDCSREDIIQALYQVILQRKSAPPDSSYTASLMTKGVDRILRKLGEESTELVIAAKGGNREEIVFESADLIFHLLVLLGYCDIEPDAVYDELRRRFGVSGLDEKASRDLGK
jgi:phosphoribosyl-ATP pyrophosphohydrolase